jgi:cell pole-organizing protein PopZ
MMPQEFTSSKPESRFKEIDNGLDNDTFYQALPEDKKEEYQNDKLEDIAKNIDETAAKAAADIENTDFYKNKLDPSTQTTTKEKTKYIEIQKKLNEMKEKYIKGIATKDINSLNEPKYPQNKVYRESYKKGLKNQEETINKRIVELDDIIGKETGQKLARAELEKITKSNQLKKIGDLYTKMKSEKKRIKDLLK